MKTWKQIIALAFAALLGAGCGARDERHYELALRYKESGDYDKAITELQAALRANPRSGKACNQLGILYGKVGVYDKAAEQFRRAVEIDPSFASGYYNLGVLYQTNLGRPSDAVIAYRRYLDLSPEGRRSEAVRKVVQGLMERSDVRRALAESVEELEELARGFLEKGEYAHAVEAYEKMLSKEPRAAARAHLEMARIYDARLDRPAEALKHYQAYLDTNLNAPDAADVMATVGKLREKVALAPTPRKASLDRLPEAESLLKSNQCERALQILIPLRDEAPDNEQVHDLLAEALAKSGDLVRAEREYEWLKSRQSDFAYSKDLLSIYRRLGEASLKSGNYAEAGERLAKAVEMAPDDGGLRSKYAQALAGEGKAQRAMEEAAAARKLAPGEAGAGAMADIYLTSARRMLSQRQFRPAEEAIEEARRLAPDRDLGSLLADLSEGRGRESLRGGKYAAAEKDLLAALRYDPKRASVHQALAALYESLGQYDRAIAELEKAARGGAEGRTAYKEMARIYETYKGDGVRAAASYRKYLAANPKAPDAAAIDKKLKAAEREKEQIAEYEKVVQRKPASVSGNYNLAVLLQRQGKYREAIDAYRKALAIEPANAQAHFNLGYSYDRLKMYEEAIDEYRKALFYKPDYLKAYSNLAAIYKDRRWYGRAIATFRKALEIDPGYAHAHLGLGSIYAESLSDRQKAIYHYRQYLKLQPNGAYAAQVRAWLAGKSG